MNLAKIPTSCVSALRPVPGRSCTALCRAHSARRWLRPAGAQVRSWAGCISLAPYIFPFLNFLTLWHLGPCHESKNILDISAYVLSRQGAVLCHGLGHLEVSMTHILGLCVKSPTASAFPQVQEH